MIEFSATEVIISLLGIVATFVGSSFALMQFQARMITSNFEGIRDAFVRESNKDREQDREQRELDRRAFEERLAANLRFFETSFGAIHDGFEKIIQRLESLEGTNATFSAVLVKHENIMKQSLTETKKGITATKADITVLTKKVDIIETKVTGELASIRQLLEKIKKNMEEKENEK